MDISGYASSPGRMCTMQGDRYSIAYFANARDSTVLQGPAKKYPPITFPQVSNIALKMPAYLETLLLGFTPWNTSAEKTVVLRKRHASLIPVPQGLRMQSDFLIGADP